MLDSETVDLHRQLTNFRTHNPTLFVRTILASDISTCAFVQIDAAVIQYALQHSSLHDTEGRVRHTLVVMLAAYYVILVRCRCALNMPHVACIVIGTLPNRQISRAFTGHRPLYYTAILQLAQPLKASHYASVSVGLSEAKLSPSASKTRAHHRDEIPERDVTYHLTCLLIYHGTTTRL